MKTSALLAALLLATTQAAASPGTPVIGPCDGCELALRGMPGQPPSESRITPQGQPGKPMRLTGTVTDGSGIPRAGVVVYAHQTDARGEYPGASSANRHGRLRGWACNDASGNYAFLTV